MSSSRGPAPLAPAPPTRRQLLAAGGLVAATAGCGLRLESPPRPPAPPPPPTPDELARERAAVRAEQLIALVAAVRRTRPDAAHDLALLAAAHRAHLAALRPTPAPATSPAPTPASLGALVAAERAAADAALADLAAVGPATARLLASVAASLRVHVAVLAPAPKRAR